jgi:sugar O-acyltransferase (sialic acid O-acetyltransferase NeuD family)
MKKINLYIIGTGDHAKVVFSEVCKIKKISFKGFINNLSLNTEIFQLDNYLKFKSIHKIINIKKLILNSHFVVAIGKNNLRKKIVLGLRKKFKNIKWAKVISTEAIIDKTVMIDEGSIIISGSTINIGSKVGKHSVINTNCSIDHDNLIGDYVDCSPGVTSAGNVVIRDGVFVGMGSSIKQNITINSNTIIGAHSFVNKNCAKDSTYYGVPIKKK